MEPPKLPCVKCGDRPHKGDRPHSSNACTIVPSCEAGRDEKALAFRSANRGRPRPDFALRRRLVKDGLGKEVHAGQHEEERIESVEEAAVAGKNRAHVLDAEVTLDE